MTAVCLRGQRCRGRTLATMRPPPMIVVVVVILLLSLALSAFVDASASVASVLLTSSSTPTSAAAAFVPLFRRSAAPPSGATTRTTNQAPSAASSGDSAASSSSAAAAASDHDGRWKQLRISFVTGNAMKVREIETILKDHGATRGRTEDDPTLVELRMLNVDLPEIQEINTEAIAKNKAIQGAQLAGGPCVVEDTSLRFTALGGMPGPFIKWFQQTLKSDGLYKILYGYEDKSATAVCTLAFCPYPHADPVVFTGVTRGTIVAPVEGRGFGWDSIFVPDGQDEPFSCMSTEKKCTLSHRGKAVRKWADWLGMNQAELWERQGGRPAIGHKGLDFKSTFPEE